MAVVLPTSGETKDISGTRIDVTVDDVVRAEGVRAPELEECHWKAGFALLHEAGDLPGADDIAQVERYRTRWETFFSEATDGLGSMDATLDGRGTGTATCVGEPTGDSDTDSDADSDGSSDGGCGCSAGPGAPGSAWLALVLALTLRRRLRSPRCSR